MRFEIEASGMALSPQHSYTVIANGVENLASDEAIPDSPSARRAHAWQVGSGKCS
jgi:hypothetical protein